MKLHDKNIGEYTSNARTATAYTEHTEHDVTFVVMWGADEGNKDCSS
jgi:hypothetical protein